MKQSNLSPSPFGGMPPNDDADVDPFPTFPYDKRVLLLPLLSQHISTTDVRQSTIQIHKNISEKNVIKKKVKRKERFRLGRLKAVPSLVDLLNTNFLSDRLLFSSDDDAADSEYMISPDIDITSGGPPFLQLMETNCIHPNKTEVPTTDTSSHLNETKIEDKNLKLNEIEYKYEEETPSKSGNRIEGCDASELAEKFDVFHSNILNNKSKQIEASTHHFFYSKKLLTNEDVNDLLEISSMMDTPSVCSTLNDGSLHSSNNILNACHQSTSCCCDEVLLHSNQRVSDVFNECGGDVVNRRYSNNFKNPTEITKEELNDILQLYS